MVTALPPFTQGLTTTLPQGGPSIGQPPHPAPDASGASPDAGEQMVPTLASPVSHRDTADRPVPTHLPTAVQPPLDGTSDPHLPGARAVPPFQEDNLQHLRTCLPAPPSAASSDSMVQNVGIARDTAGSLRGTSAAATGNAGLEAAMASGGSRASQPAVRNPDPSRQSHPPTTHPIAAASLREPLNVGGSEFAAATSNAGFEAAMASGGSRAAQPTLNPDPSRHSHPPTTHPIAAASLREPLNVRGSELETQNSPLPLPLPQPAGPNDVLDGLTTANTGCLPSSLSASLAATLETASQTLAASNACVIESQDLRDSIEETASPTGTPHSLAPSSSTLPARMADRMPDLAEQQRIILAIKAHFPRYSGLSADQDKALLATFYKSPEEAQALRAKMLLRLILPLEDKHAGQLVSMFLELDNKDIWDLILFPELLSAKVAEAVKLLSPTRPSPGAGSAASRSVHFAAASSSGSPPPSSRALAPPPGLGHFMEASETSQRDSYANAARTLESRFAAIQASEERIVPQGVPLSVEAPETSESSSTSEGKQRVPAVQMDVDPSFNTPVNASYIPYSAGNKRKGLEPSPELSSGASSPGVAADHLLVPAAVGPVGADLVPGQYVQVSAGTTKSSYKNRIFRVAAVHAKASDLEWLDDWDSIKSRPNVKNHLLLVPGPSAVNLQDYQNLKVQRPGDPFWTYIAVASVEPSETSSTGAVTGVPHPLVSSDASITRPRSTTPDTMVPARILQHPAEAPPAASSSSSAGAQAAARRPVRPRADPLLNRNHDYRFMGVQICTLRKDPATGFKRKYWYTVVGVETGQFHAYSLQDRHGKVRSVDCLARFLMEPEDNMTVIGQWQPLPGQSIPKVSPGNYVCPDCFVVNSRAPCIICNPPEAPEADHFLVSGFSASHGQSGPTDTMLSAPPAASPPLVTPPPPAPPEPPRRCSTLSSASGPPSTRASPAYHSASEDLPEADGTTPPGEFTIPHSAAEDLHLTEEAPEPPDEFTILGQTQAEGVGDFEGQPSGFRFYAVAAGPQPRILCGTWKSVSPLIEATLVAIEPSRADGGPVGPYTGPVFDGSWIRLGPCLAARYGTVDASDLIDRFKDETNAIQHMNDKGFLLPNYTLRGGTPREETPRTAVGQHEAGQLRCSSGPSVPPALPPPGPMVTVTQGSTSHLPSSSSLVNDPPGPMVTVTQGPTSHLPSSSAPPPPPVDYCETVVIPTSLTKKPQQERAIALIKELVDSKRQLAIQVVDLESQVFVLDESRTYDSVQLDRLTSELKASEEFSMIASSDLALCESKLAHLTAAHHRLQDQSDSPVASLEQQLADLREESLRSTSTWTAQVGDLTRTNWALRQKEDEMRIQAGVAERDAAQRIAELNQLYLNLRDQVSAEEVQAEIVGSPAVILGSNPPPPFSPTQIAELQALVQAGAESSEEAEGTIRDLEATVLEAGASEQRAVDQAALSHASMVDSDRLLAKAKERLLQLESTVEYQSGQIIRNAASRDRWKRSCEGLTRERTAEQTAAEEYSSNLQLVERRLVEAQEKFNLLTKQRADAEPRLKELERTASRYEQLQARELQLSSELESARVEATIATATYAALESRHEAMEERYTRMTAQHKDHVERFTALIGYPATGISSVVVLAARNGREGG